MKIELHEIPIYEIADGYIESQENGVFSYNGKLNIRPAFQREFVYNDKQRDDVIRSIMKNYPLNVMYWICNEGGKYEMLDGQQRTISICRYVYNQFAVGNRKFENLSSDEQEQILNYRLMIYFCDGKESEKYAWFKIVNIVGAKLTDQEMRNAVYPGQWLEDAKKRFSKSKKSSHDVLTLYLSGNSSRQDYLETVLRWAGEHEGHKGKPDSVICDYMANHQKDFDAGELWLYFQNVINWVNAVFPNYRKEMRGIQWGLYYNRYHDQRFNAHQLEQRFNVLLDDDDVTSVSGIYEYLLDGQEKHLNLRKFKAKEKRAAYERQNGKCAVCGGEFDIKDMQADHITPWSKGGHTKSDNCQMLCRSCNRKKSNV